MAPEQFAGKPTDARTDQFAFCVMLWEALYGERPFGGERMMALATNVLEARRRPPPRGVRVPRWLRAVVHRGLAPQPDARWPSLTKLLTALDRGRRRSRVAKALAGASALTLLVAAGLGSSSRRSGPSTPMWRGASAISPPRTKPPVRTRKPLRCTLGR